MFASPDVGGIKRARSFAKFFDAELAVCDKYRKRRTRLNPCGWLVKLRANVILVDDLVDTGGTLCKAAGLLKKRRKTVRLVCTHPVLSGNAYENIENSVLEELVVDRYHPLKSEHQENKSIDYNVWSVCEKPSAKFMIMSQSVHYSSVSNFP